MADVEYIDIRPSAAYHGTGMIPEGDYDITDARFGPWDYNGTQAVAVPALGVEFKSGDQPYTQWYSAGDMKNMEPTEDGKRLKKVGSTGSLNDQCNCYQFLAAAVRAGFDEEALVKDISAMIGYRVSVVHEPTAERDIKGTKKKAGTLAVVGKILSKPEEKSKKATANAGSKKANGQEVPASSAINKKATDALIGALKGAAGNQLLKRDLTSALWSKYPPNDNDRGAVMNLIIQDSFLSSLADQGVLYDVANALVMYAGG